MGIPGRTGSAFGRRSVTVHGLLVAVERVAPWDGHGDGVLTCVLV